MQLAAAAAMATGFAVILHTPLPAPWRVLAAIAWLSSQALELAAWSRSAARWRALAIRAGRLEGLFDKGIWCELTLCPGSLVTARWAWLALVDGEGRPTCAVLRASRVAAPAWRRLAVWYRSQR